MSALNPGVLVCPQKESGQATAPLSQRIRPGGVQLRRQQGKKKRKEKKRGGSQQAKSTTRDQEKKLMEEENLGRRGINNIADRNVPNIHFLARLCQDTIKEE